jgi:DNA-binding NarL/FixJ family response regulator
VSAVVRVLVADDQKVVRDGLALMLSLLPGIVVAGTAGDGDEAVRRTLATDPDVVLMDLHMPVVDGVEAIRRLVERGARARAVVLTTYADDESVFGALQAGAWGFLTKDAGAEEIHRAVRTVAAGDALLDPSVQRRLLEALRGATGLGGAPGVPAHPTDGLTPREEEVLVEIARGLTNGEIAERLVVSEATVKTHVNRLLTKTGCRDRAGLVAHAYRTGRTPDR